MKTVFISILLCSAFASARCQEDATANTLKNIQHIPGFSILAAPDSSTFTNGQLQKGKPFVLMFFNPDCDHCQKETKELLAYKEEIKDIQILMVSALDYPLIRTFYIDYSILLMPNIKMGQDVDYVLGAKYRPTRYPAIYVYDAAGNLAKVFAGNAGVKAILESLK